MSAEFYPTLPPSARRRIFARREFHLLFRILSATLAGGCAAGPDDGEDFATASQRLGEDGGVLDASAPPDGDPADGDPGFPPEGPTAVGRWLFDDCSTASQVLADSTSLGADAKRSTSATCGAGLDGQAVVFNERKDSVDVPANAEFALSSSVTVAAWVNPQGVSQGSLINKQLQGSTTFELSIHRGNAQFSVNLRQGNRTRKVTSSAPIAAGKWTHVAGVYDGSFLRLFLNGAQVGQVADAGVLADVNGPLRIGNNAQSHFVTGSIDDVFFSDQALSAGELAQLSCIQRPLLVTVTPPSSGLVQPETPVTYDVAVTNSDVGACSPRDLAMFFDSVPEGFSTNIPEQFQLSAPGETVHFSPVVTGTADAEPGAHQLSFAIVDFNVFEFTFGQLEYVLAEPSGCFVRTGRELLIRDLSVVEDPRRTTFDGPADDPRTGAWTFASLMRQMAPSPEQAPQMVERMFSTWLTDQTVNGFVMPARTSMATQVLDVWPRSENGELDLVQAPLRLLAIVNRIDSRNLAQGHAGEGRFVFGVVDRDGFPFEFTVILEYRLPATSTAEVLEWANAWHALGALPFPSEQYNAALQELTARFAGRGAEPGRVNGNALAQLRTNEIALDSPWELREFELSASTGMLEPATVKLTPDTSFLFESPLVANYVNQNEQTILAEQHVVPETFEGTPFLGASSFNDLVAWRSSGITNNEARHKFSLNTCNGCHSSEETGTAFLHVFPRFPGEQSSLSGFMTGTVVSDPVTLEPRPLNDLRRRNTDLLGLVCPAEAPEVTPPAVTTSTSSSAKAARERFISKGIGRVH